ncbi:MAG: septum formation initiator family protein [Bacteroidetes bacterium]|nr:septum formation initiator family protein [Bacteroidota bacterium]
MKKIWQKYRFWLIGASIAVWMIIFDSNNFIDLIQLRAEIRNLTEKRTYYITEIAKAKKEQMELFTDKKNLEKFAREKYFMKKDNEDLFIFLYPEKK